MKLSFNAVRSPRMPGGTVSWVGVGFAVAMIAVAGAKRLIKGGRRRSRGTGTPAPQPKAQMRSETPKPAANGASKRTAPSKAPAKPKSASSKSVPKTETSTPTGHEEVKAQKAARAKGTQSPPKKRATKVSPGREKTQPGRDTNPKNPRSKQAL